MSCLARVTGLVLAMTNAGVSMGQSALPVHPDHIKTYETVWRVTITRPDGTILPQGLWSDQLLRIPYQGHPSVRRVQGFTFVTGGSATWVNVLDPTSLRPIMHTERGRDGRVTTREFGDHTVLTRHTAASGAVEDSTRTSLDGVVYDYLAGTYGLLLSTLPLASGYTATFASIDAATDSVRPVTIKVIGRERVSAGRGRLIDTWQVADGDLVYSIADEPPYVMKLVEHMKDGATETWELP